MERRRKSQSAMEYLMTYGWAIVAIAVVIGVLYSLGVFRLGTSGGTGCTVIEGFSCTKPILYSSGILVMGLGQVGNSELLRAKALSFMQLARLVMKPFPRCPAS